MTIIFISYNGALEPVSQSQVIPYLKGLSMKGFNLHLLSFEKKLDLRNYDNVKKISIELEEAGIRWHKLTYHKNPPIFSTLYDMFIGTIYCAWIILKTRNTILHARSYVPASIAFVLNRILGERFIFDMRGMMIDEYAEGGIFKEGGFLYKAGKKIEKELLLSASKIIVLTDKIKNIIINFSYLQNRNYSFVDVIPCCVDLKEFVYTENQEERRYDLTDSFLFVYTGSVGTWYFLEGMLDLFAEAKKKIPKAHFLFLSHGNEDLIKNAVEKKRLDLRDFTIGEAGHNEICRYLCESDAGVVFYKQAFSRQACFPIKLGEYLACGLPVVINSGIGDTEEIVKSNKVGVVVKGLSKENYADAIDELVEIKREGALLSRRCRATAEKLFSLELGIQKYKQVYEEVDANK